MNIIGLDVGGTVVKGALVELKYKPQIVGKTYAIPSPESKTGEEIISDLINFIVKIIDENKGIKIDGIGIGFPDPFNYENGISHIKHKFKLLDGHNLKKPIEEATNLPCFFVNDADAFGLGVFAKLKQNRILAITLGTGLGGSFVVNGKLKNQLADDEKNKIPEDGRIWNVPYQGTILEDFASKRAIENRYLELSGQKEEVVNIADKARAGDENAKITFEEVGTNMGEGLKNVIEKFKPEIIVFGGQISKAFDLIEPAFKRNLNTKIELSSQTSENYGIYGAAQNALNQIV